MKLGRPMVAFALMVELFAGRRRGKSPADPSTERRCAASPSIPPRS
jgi:hypothetical protein